MSLGGVTFPERLFLQPQGFASLEAEGLEKGDKLLLVGKEETSEVPMIDKPFDSAR